MNGLELLYLQVIGFLMSVGVLGSVLDRAYQWAVQETPDPETTIRNFLASEVRQILDKRLEDAFIYGEPPRLKSEWVRPSPGITEEMITKAYMGFFGGGRGGGKNMMYNQLLDRLDKIINRGEGRT